MIVNSKIIVSRKQSIEEDGIVHLINPIVELQVPFLPTTISFSIFASIVVSVIENNYEAKVIITDVDDVEILSVGGPLNSPNIGERGTLQLNIQADDIIIKKDGKYLCKLYINDLLVAEYDFSVFNKKIDLD